jgi:nucleoside-diphosphate-sugar epimerase
MARMLVTGGSGVLGRVLLPLLRAAGHEPLAPRREELDLFDPAAVREAVQGKQAVFHLATRIPPADRSGDREAWAENDRLRAEASRLLVDAALASGAATYVQPTVAFMSDDDRLASAREAEAQTARFAAAGRRGVVLRLGLLDGPGTGNDAPVPVLGVTLHVEDAARALRDALTLPSGIYDVARERHRLVRELP